MNKMKSTGFSQRRTWTATTSLAMAIDRYGKENVVALSVYYGQKHDQRD